MGRLFEKDRSEMTREVLEYVKRVQALAKIGLSYTENPFDIERYEELREISEKLQVKLTDMTLEQVRGYFSALDSYPTPKSDVRAAIFQDGQILLIRERTDGRWAMPGGWCDIGLTPSENVIKEVREESGLEVKVNRLLAVWDKKMHDHPPTPVAVYKFIFLCEITGGQLAHGFEVLDQGFFDLNDLPPLSMERNTPKQLERIFQLSRHPHPTVCD